MTTIDLYLGYLVTRLVEALGDRASERSRGTARDGQGMAEYVILILILSIVGLTVLLPQVREGLTTAIGRVFANIAGIA